MYVHTSSGSASHFTKTIFLLLSLGKFWQFNESFEHHPFFHRGDMRRAEDLFTALYPTVKVFFILSDTSMQGKSLKTYYQNTGSPRHFPCGTQGAGDLAQHQRMTAKKHTSTKNPKETPSCRHGTVKSHSQRTQTSQCKGIGCPQTSL